MRHRLAYWVLTACALSGGEVAWGDIGEDPLPVQLKERGVEVKDAAAVEAAVKSPDASLRVLTIRYLASTGKDITRYLKDPEFEVRRTIANLLADEGRREGMATMEADFDRFAMNGMGQDAETFLRMREEVTRDLSLGRALDAAFVLARLGDFRGQKLAELALTHAPLEAHRYRAVMVLGEIVKSARTAKNQAVAALEAAAKTEQKAVVLQMVVGVMTTARGPEGEEVLKALQAATTDADVKRTVDYVLNKMRVEAARGGGAETRGR